MDQKFVHVVHNIKHLWVIMWHIFTSTNNTTTILFPTQLWERLCTYHVIKQCTEKETTLHKLCATFSASVRINYRLPIKVDYRICTLRHIRIEINHGSQNVFLFLTWIGGY
jgi:hypothetical protein